MSDEALRVLKPAVCVLLSNSDGEVLGVSRKDDSTAFGLPGGKNDLIAGTTIYETDIDAIIRETREETGLELDPESIREVYRGPCLRTKPDGEDFDVVTFTASWSGEIKTREKGVVKWLPAHVLVAPTAPFRWYNWEVYRRLGVVP